MAGRTASIVKPPAGRRALVRGGLLLLAAVGLLWCLFEAGPSVLDRVEGRTTVAADQQSAVEVRGCRYSIESLRRQGDALTVSFKIKTAARRGPAPLDRVWGSADLVFLDADGLPIDPPAQFDFSHDTGFLIGSTDQERRTFLVYPPAGTRFLSVRCDRPDCVTTPVPIPEKSAGLRLDWLERLFR